MVTRDLEHLLTASRRRSMLPGACLMLAFSGHSLAQYEARAFVPNGSLIGRTTTPGDFAYAYDSGKGASAVATFTSSPVVSVGYATSASDPSGRTGLTGGGLIEYRFSVATEPFTNVPIDFSGFYSSFQGSAGQRAQTYFSLETTSSPVSSRSDFQSSFYGDCGAVTCLDYNTRNASYTTSRPDSFNVAGTFQGTLGMLTGAAGTVAGLVTLLVGADLDVSFGSASAAAFVTPHLEIAPTFLTANPGATLTITPGVGNAILAVPEPNSYAFLLAGLAAIAVVVRRGKAERSQFAKHEA